MASLERDSKIERGQTNLPAWAVSALDPKFGGRLIDGTDEIAVPPKIPGGPPRSDPVQWRFDLFVGGSGQAGFMS